MTFPLSTIDSDSGSDNESGGEVSEIETQFVRPSDSLANQQASQPASQQAT